MDKLIVKEVFKYEDEARRNEVLKENLLKIMRRKLLEYHKP